MADLEKISQISGQIAFEEPGKQKISGISGQIAYEEPGNLKFSGLAMQIAYQAIPPGISVSGLAMQIAYEEGTGGGTPTQEQLMRHGTWFGDGVKKPMWWGR